MEHTKGEFEARDNRIYRKQTYIGGCAGYFGKTAFSDDADKANAKELVRRWNAFEKDGLVDELVVACEAQEEADNWFGASNTGRKLKDKAKKLRVAAIAKAKASGLACK